MEEELLATETPPSFMDRTRAAIGRKYQHFMDISTVWTKTRWITFALTMVLYFLHVFYGLSENEIRNGGYAIVTYALGIYLLNLFIGFLTPQVKEFPIVCSCVLMVWQMLGWCLWLVVVFSMVHIERIPLRAD